MKFKENIYSIILLIIFTTTFALCSNNVESTEDANVTTSSTVEVTVIEDTTAPVFTTEPQITDVTSNSVNISWVVEDDFGAPEIQLSLNDIVVYKGKDTQYQITDLNPETTYNVVLIASDLNNNITTKTFTITTKQIVDNDPPRFLKALTLDNITFESATISWEVEDLLSDFNLILLVNEQEIYEFTSPFVINNLKPNEKYTISLTATDNSNNIASNSIVFQTPQDPSIEQESINFVSPLKVSDITSDSALVTWEVQNETGNVTYTLFIGDQIIYTGQDNSFKLLELIPENYYELDLTASDESSSEIFSFTSFTTAEYIDDIKPQFINELNDTSITSTSINLSWKATDNVGISYYILKEGSNQIYKGLSEERQIEGLIEDTVYSFSVEAIDKEGNISVSTLSVQTLPISTTTTTTTTTTSTTTTTIPDNDPPVFDVQLDSRIECWDDNYSYVLEGSADPESEVELSWGATDSISSVSYSLSRNGTVIYSGDAPCYKDSGLTGGIQYNYTVTASDTSLNTATSSYSHTTVDLTNPQITSGPLFINVGARSATITWSVSDNSGYVNTWVKYGQINVGDVVYMCSGGTCTGSHSYTATNLNPNTQYKFEITVSDNRPNRITTTQYVTTLIDNQPAWTSLPSLSNSSSTQTDISWTCTDESGDTIINKIESQRFLPGYSPTYDGQVYSGNNSSGSSVTVTLTGLDPDYVYEYNVYCEDQNGNSSDRQVTLPVER